MKLFIAIALISSQIALAKDLNSTVCHAIAKTGTVIELEKQPADNDDGNVINFKGEVDGFTFTASIFPDADTPETGSMVASMLFDNGKSLDLLSAISIDVPTVMSFFGDDEELITSISCMLDDE